MNSTVPHHPRTIMDGCIDNNRNEEGEASNHQLESHANDWLDDCRQAPVKRFHSFANLRRQLGHRKKVLQEEREQRELMEQPQQDDSANEVVHELGKPFLSSFTRSHLRIIRNKWKVEEPETIVFDNDENASPDEDKPTKKNEDKSTLPGASNTKRAKKKREKKKWMSRAKNRASTLSGKTNGNSAANGASTTKKKKTASTVASKIKAKMERTKQSSSLKRPIIRSPSSSLPISFEQRMAMRLQQRVQHERSSQPKRPREKHQREKKEYDTSSADRVAVGVEEELLHEATSDYVPSLGYPKGIKPGGSQERARPSSTYTPYCYSSDDDSSRREKSLQTGKSQKTARPVELRSASLQADFSEDSSFGSVPSVIVRSDEATDNSRDSGFADLVSQKGALDQSFEEKGKIRIGRTIVGVLDADAQSTSSIESGMESIPCLLNENALPGDILHIDGESAIKDDASVDLIPTFDGKVETVDLDQPEDVEDSTIQWTVSFNPSSSSSNLQQQSHQFQSEGRDNTSFWLTEETESHARHLGEQLEQADSPPPSPIQPTILEVQSYNDADRLDIDDIPVEENARRSMFRKLLSCGSGIKIPTTGKDLKAKASGFRQMIKKKSNGNENASTSPTNFSFLTNSSPTGTTFTSSPSSTRSDVAFGHSPCRMDEHTAKLPSFAIRTPVKKKSIVEIRRVDSKSSAARDTDPEEPDPFTTPPKTKKPFDYRRPTPAKATQRSSSNTKSSPVTLILNSFERLTKKDQRNRSPRRTRRLKKIMSKLEGKKLPMLIAIGLAALFQSVLNNLDASNALTMLVWSSSTPLMLLWDGGLDAAVGGMAGFAQAMIAQG